MSASSNAALIACSLSAWTGEKGRCVWCNTELTGRRSRWCSDACVDAFAEQHWWAKASRAAKERDDWRCVRCGRKPERDWENDEWPNARNGKPLMVEAHHRDRLADQVHAENGAWSWRAGERIRHSESGCHHHIDLLETLCTDCHHDEHHPPGELDPQLEIEAA